MGVPKVQIQEGREKLMRLQTQYEVMGEFPGCRSCFHYRRERSFEYCAHPVFCDMKRDVADGGVDLVPNMTPIDFAREEGSLCGPEGHLYEHTPLSKTRRRLRRIKWLDLLAILVITVGSLAVFKRADIFMLPFLLGTWFFFMGLPIRSE